MGSAPEEFSPIPPELHWGALQGFIQMDLGGNFGVWRSENKPSVLGECEGVSDNSLQS